MEKERPSLLTNSELFGPVTRLITLIAEAVWTVAQQFPSSERFFIDCDWSISRVNDIALRHRLKARGWCPSLFDNVKNMARTPSSFLEYVSLVPPLGDTMSQHQQCSLNGCVEHNIDESVYRTKHRMDDCHCEMIRPPLSNVDDALRNWTIPVMSASSLLKLDSAPIVQAYSPDRPLEFVAFSHVWSDGLGSTTEAGIPKCQVEFLMETSLRAAGTPLFWIDSLCIPKIRDMRKLAISMMSETYRSASATVVLDRKIKRCDSKRSLETRIVALSLSTW
jgi:Heterokaryon incompatibility protein (HET)